jgi:thiamine-phosphate pyrophosphorylase
VTTAPLPFRVLVITDWTLGTDELLRRLALALRAGPGLAVQHRHPGAADRQFFDEAVRVKQVCDAAGAPLFVNSRLDVALAVGAHLHCTSHSLPPRELRGRLPDRWVSCVVHAKGDDVEGADLALVSPVFRPRSKAHDTRPPLGAAGFEKLAATLPCPAFALGGIDVNTAGSISGAGVAVISGVLHAADPEAAARALLNR